MTELRVVPDPEHAALQRPISSIIDGWVLQTGDLYLQVDMGDGTNTMIGIPRWRLKKRLAKR